MSTADLTEITINKKFFREFCNDLQMLGIKHEPFWRIGDLYRIRIRTDTRIAFLKLKYENR